MIDQRVASDNVEVKNSIDKGLSDA